MSGFKVGDVVVCVDDFGTWACRKIKHLDKGSVYHVAAVGTAERGQGVLLHGVPSLTVTGLYWSGRFRKIQKADDAFTAQMRALKPIKQKS